MRLTTKNFGEIDVDESKIITFGEGVPGFIHCHRFILLEEESGDETQRGVIWWLQSVDDSDVAFVLMNVFAIMPDYNPTIDPEDIVDLGEYTEEDFVVYNVAVITENVKDVRVNLKAPVVINTLTMKGKQVLATNEDYSIRYHIFRELEKRR